MHVLQVKNRVAVGRGGLWLTELSFGARPDEPIEMKNSVRNPWDKRVVDIMGDSMGNASVANSHNNSQDYWSADEGASVPGKSKVMYG